MTVSPFGQAVVVSFMVLPLLSVVILNLLSKKSAKASAVYICAFTAACQMGAALYCAFLLWQNIVDSVRFSVFWKMEESLGAAFFSADYYSLLALFCIGLVSLIAVLVAHATMQKHMLNFSSLLLVLMLGMNGLSMASDFFSLYIFLEITAIASFVLIALTRSKRGLEGSFKYLVMSAVATAMLLVSIALIFIDNGTLAFSALSSVWPPENLSFLSAAAFVLLLAGLCIKAGITPFHSWVPDAYQNAPSAVSVLLAGVVTKMAGVYVMLRMIALVLPQVEQMNFILMAFGLLSILYGAFAALGQSDFKRILAYSSISQMGYIAVAIALNTPLALFGAAFHFLNHALFKSTLFVNAAAVKRQTGTDNINELGGLAKKMPVTGTSSVLAFLSAAGLPPLAGFWSKVIIIVALWDQEHFFAAGLAIFASLFTLAYFLRLQRKVFFGPQEEHLTHVKEASPPLSWSAGILSFVTVGLGVLFPLFLYILRNQGII